MPSYPVNHPPFTVTLNRSVMSTLYLKVLLLLVFALPTGCAHGQNGFGHQPTPQPCLLPEQRRDIQRQLEENLVRLDLKRPSRVKSYLSDLSFPLRVADSIPGVVRYFGNSGYVDHDASAGFRDYRCRSNSYDGHRGTDWNIFPFFWMLQENDVVEVVSAAPGVIILRQDGNSDTNCVWGNQQWNAVYVRHDDGSVMWYGHLKRGSLTEKQVGDAVERGEYLGIVGSSGRSTGPHLHMEYYDSNGDLLDPYTGACNDLNDESLWMEQEPYVSTTLNAVLTHSEAPSVAACGPANEVVALENTFLPGSAFFVGTYITGYRAGDRITTRVFRPDGSLFNSYESFNENNFGWFWNWRSYQLTDFAPHGTWRVEAQFGTQRIEHTFEVMDELTDVAELNRIDALKMQPNPATDFVTISGARTGAELHYQIFSPTGQAVRAGSATGGRLNVSDLAPGLFLVQFRYPNGQSTVRRLVKR